MCSVWSWRRAWRVPFVSSRKPSLISNSYLPLIPSKIQERQVELMRSVAFLAARSFLTQIKKKERQVELMRFQLGLPAWRCPRP